MAKHRRFGLANGVSRKLVALSREYPAEVKAGANYKGNHMIKIKNEQELIFELRKAGAAAVANDIDNIVAPANGFIKAVFAAFGVMGTDGSGAPTQDVIADLKKNGTSIFSGATKINFSHAKQLGTANTPILADNYGALSSNPVPVNKGDFLRLDITQILNGTSPVQPTDLVVYVVFARGYTWAPEATLLGQISEQD